jgi:hypothetical protein
MFILGFVFGVLAVPLAGAVCVALDEHWWGTLPIDEEWCGCDGEGMAHLPGAEGFACDENVTVVHSALDISERWI